MEFSPIIVPVVALVCWTLLIMLWMFVARFGAFTQLGVTLEKIPPGSRGSSLDGNPEIASAQWKSHNYNHLMEQPTIFYAIVFSLALMGAGSGIDYWLAWGYVGLRIVHSLVQCTVNVVKYRLALFGLATLCLAGLAVHAAALILRHCGII